MQLHVPTTSLASVCTVMLAVLAMADEPPRMNVVGKPLQACCHSPKTGFARDGFCRAIDADHGTHTVCAIVTQEFLQFTQSRGNDLITPRPEHAFPGLKPGDRWCLCALRYREALKAGKAPNVVLESTDARTLEYVPLADLQAHAHVLN